MNIHRASQCSNISSSVRCPAKNWLKGNRKALWLIDQFLMTYGLVIADRSFRFGVSKTTCSDVINKWIDWLDVHLSFLTYWPTREQIDNTIPSDFKERFPRTRVIIDRTEIPQSLAQQSLMYSQYKSHMTWKALIGITPNGVVSLCVRFMARLYQW